MKDQNDAVVANATVSLTNKATGAARKLTTNSDGDFSFENLLPIAARLNF